MHIASVQTTGDYGKTKTFSCTGENNSVNKSGDGTKCQKS